MSGLLKRLAECSLIVPKLGGNNVSTLSEMKTIVTYMMSD